MPTIDLNAGALAPVATEAEYLALPVTGDIPGDLNGVLVRNGPNPLTGRFEGQGVLGWWPEAAMLHGISFEGGRATAYRNKWLRTQRCARVYEPQSVSSRPDTNPNVNVIRHAGETLALAEGGVPLPISPLLDTLKRPSRHPFATNGMTAHSKIDPETGELIMFGREFEENPLGRLHRYRIDLAPGQVQEHAVAVLGIELPRINERLTGRPYRYFYAVEQPNTSEMRGIVRYDWQSAAFERYALAPGDQNSEPVFVPRRGARTEDDGWLLSCVYRHTTATSDVVVLDARDIAAGPIATVHLPTRIPSGFHGQWLDNDHEG
ncbi:carotenoid oxygenase family protein [Trinickia diaoshuihuensis]|uniref:carotenoid oxygenase family protein n=1 Tax=Trinickia diaoshuihuensis TaxID=2292265 RepID=UPI000E259C90|nr:carotenoid oxygenase family protein [Trinickia diaoshuihuensis]